jgi:hypothetical protein
MGHNVAQKFKKNEELYYPSTLTIHRRSSCHTIVTVAMCLTSLVPMLLQIILASQANLELI